jgi:hypothetical protein
MDLGSQPLDKRALLEGDLKIQAELYDVDSRVRIVKYFLSIFLVT